MQRDYRIGVVSGLALAAFAVLWLAARSGFSTKASLAVGSYPKQVRDVEPLQQASGRPYSPSADEVTAQNVENNQSPTPNHQPEVPDLTVYEQPEKIKTDRFHFVQKGETLSGISHQYYGSAGKWQKILDANPNVVKDPRNLKWGTKLIIPE